VFCLRDGHILILDEAQHLDQVSCKTCLQGEALQWPRDRPEATGRKVVFAGDVPLQLAIETMPQPESRLIRPVVIHKITRADVAALVAGMPFDNDATVTALHALAQAKGGWSRSPNQPHSYRAMITRPSI